MLDITKAKELIDRANVVSFDIFDTLIRRTVDSPLGVFHLMKGAAYELSSGHVSDFRSVRVKAEKAALEKARERGVEEITFDEIYREIKELTGIDDATAARIQALEVETELRCVHARVAGRDLLHYAKMRKKRAILASDMYLPRSAIERLLNQAGIGVPGVLYLSNELMKTKREGDLFRHILDDLRVHPSAMVHFGDNPKGDVSSPKELGIETFYIPRSILNYRESSEFGKRLTLAAKKHWSLTKSVVDAMIADRFFDDVSKRSLDSFFRGDPFQFGYAALGPMMLGLSFWLHREAKADGIRRLYFLSRDGLVMKRVFDELFPSAEYGIETEYLYCSRRMARVPLMRNRFDLLQVIARPIHSRTLGNWLEANYGMSPDEVEAELFELHGFEGPGAIINNNVDRDALAALIQQLEGRLLEIAAEERSHLVRYLEHKGVGAGRHAVVDIGYAGTMQESLSSLLGKSLKGYYLAVFGTSSGVKNQQDLKGFVSQHGADDNPALGICTHRFVYESLVCSSEDTVIRVAETPNGFEPIARSSDVDWGRKCFVDYAHSGAVALAKEYKANSPIAPEDSFLSPEASTLAFDLYLREPMPKDVSLLYGISFEDLYGVTSTRYLAAGPATRKSLQPSQIIWKESLKVKPPPVKAPVPKVAEPPAKAAETAAKKALANNEFVVAAENFIRAYKLSPDRPNYLRAAGEAYLKAGEKRLALEKLNEYQKLNPGNKRVKARQWVIRFPPLAKIIGDQEFVLQ
ncbi:hypothetical protein GOB57_03875 [Sinorhizobium meliloti]|nr:hypothetical protein [Sinorhizobium meliloti]